MLCLLFASVLTALSLPAFAGKPAAVDCADLVDSACISELESLCIATEDATSLESRDRNGMLGKLLSSNVKLTQDKVAEASAKLDDYEAKLNLLNEATKPKISDEDFVALLAELLEAQICVGGY